MVANVSELLVWVILVALTAGGLIQLARQLPWVDAQMMAGKKPWVCDLCMSWWTSLLSTLGWILLDNAPWRAHLPAFALTMLVTHLLGKPTSEYEPPPELSPPTDATPELIQEEP